jgi:deazaflavin-dependent oxidoreductase (nitroreductase family)
MSPQPARPRRGLARIFGTLHTFFYRRGIGRRFQGAPAILLTTTGRKSGRPVTTPLLAQRDGDAFIVIASWGGADQHPSWWLNLLTNPAALVQDGDQEIRVRAGEVTDPTEKARLWRKMTAVYPGYDGYTRKTRRVIPLALLRPVQQDGRALSSG